MDKFKIIILTPPSLINPSLAIAGSRAGGLGVLDLEFAADILHAKDCMEKLSLYSRNPYGIRLNCNHTDLLSELTSISCKLLQTVILTNPLSKETAQTVEALKSKGLTVFLECISMDEAQSGSRAGVDGIIAKGNEAGGRVSNDATFVLLQQILKNCSMPVFAQGGIGLHTAASCYAAGAQGVVLDSQLLLTRESPFPQGIKTRLERMDGTETIILGEDIGECYRVCSRLGISAVKKMQEKSKALYFENAPDKTSQSKWYESIYEHVIPDSDGDNLVLIGQDIAFAKTFLKKNRTVGDIVQSIKQSINTHCRLAKNNNLLSEGSLLAVSHGTRYPIVQGPMARISDDADFIAMVADKGALPFVAAAWMKENELDTLLGKTSRLLQNKAWGVGLLGFLPSDVYKKQIEKVIAHHPPFALIAGGQPDQAKELEAHGISTYIHVPSPGLLKIFLDNGLKRFVFEGRESGGHVGPLCSFSLWETMIEILLESIALKDSSEDIHVLFAGGIHDALSASMVAVMAAPLAEHGVNIGFQLGSAYLFTEEAVSTGAVVEKYLDEVVGCNTTTLLNMGVGHAVRCVSTPFAETFKKEKFRLYADGASVEESTAALEKIQLGRLRIASKGTKRKSDSYGGSALVDLTDEEQYLEGMYMVGQLAALRSHAFNIDELHSDISINGSGKIDQLMKEHIKILPNKEDIRPSDIAIVGMSCLLPKASDVKQYWENIINKVNAIREIPEERWDIELYFHENPQIQDKVYSKWGAFLEDIYFDPVRFGMPPNSLPSIEPLQLLALEVARNGLKDAGYDQRSFPRERTSVIFGISGVGELAQQYSFKTALPGFFGEGSRDIISNLDHMLPQWTEDSFPGLLMNVTSGRIANRLDLGGTNFTVDSACASSLTAVCLSVRELESKNSDMVIVGGADCMQNPFTYMCFSKTQALSPRGCCNALDEKADGIVLGEGLAVMVMKRLADAERDGDHIYSVIKGVGASSDGRDKSLTAPGRSGQIRSLNRAYAKACFSPDTVELIEAHATGTSVGDNVELGSIGEVFKAAGAKYRSCAVGTIKSMIGHTKSTAGIAGLIKTALALEHKVLPPTLGIEKPNAMLLSADTPFYVNTETRPWIHSNPEHPRRAGVSAFGFGGTNFHVVLEEYKDNFLEQSNFAPIEKWHSELIVIQGKSRNDLLNNVKELENTLAKGARLLLGDLAYTYALKKEQTYAQENTNLLTISIIASSFDDLSGKLKSVKEAISARKPVISDPRGIYFAEKGLAEQGKTAFLFPGQGSQYNNMLADLAIQYDEIRKIFESSDLILKDKLDRPLSTFIFPAPVFTEEDKQACVKALEQTCIAQPAIGTAALAIYHVLTSLGVTPDMVAGHSYGEYVALHAAGVLSKKDLILLSEARGRIILESTGNNPGTMAAVQADVSTIDDIIRKIDDVWVANLNAPNLTIISGSQSGVKKAMAQFSASNIKARSIPVACAFHSPIVAPSCEMFKNFLSKITFSSPNVKVFSNTDPIIYPVEPQAISDQLVRHFTGRVDFVRQIEEMYQAGARIFVEVGPGRVLSGLVDKILGDRPHLSVISDQPERSGLLQMQHMIGQLIAHGVFVNIPWIYKGRSLKPIDLKTLNPKTGQSKISPTSWVVNGYSASPLHKIAGADKKMPVKPIKLNVLSDKPGTESMQENTSKRPDPGTVNSLENSVLYQKTKIPISGQGHPSGNNSSKVMLKFQEVMQQFLDVQKNVLSNYFRSVGHVPDAGRRIRNNALSEMPLKSSYVSESSDQTKSHHDHAQKIYADEKQPQPLSAPEVSVKPDVALSLEKTCYDRDRLTLELLDIVSDRTGYPKEMLDLDANLEADLGIDSIKRVEIFSQFFKNVFQSQTDGLPEQMKDLNNIKTLRKIIDRIEGYADEKQPHPSTTHAFVDESEPSLGSEGCHDARYIKTPRFAMAYRQADPPVQSATLSFDKVVIMIDDDRGIAVLLSEKIQHMGCKVIHVQCGMSEASQAENVYHLEDHSKEHIEALIEDIRSKHGDIAGLVNLMPLNTCASYEEMDMDAWVSRLDQDVKTFFRFLKTLEKDLSDNVGHADSFVMSATGMGGYFASINGLENNEFFPGQGGISGLLKTLDVEWPKARVKVVDLNLDNPVDEIAKHLLAEIVTDDGIVEVGYDGSRRLVLGLKYDELTDRPETMIDLDSSSVILITGGARGITAEIACELARRYRPVIILAGHSAEPCEKEPEETVGFVLPHEIKNAIIKKMKTGRKDVNLSHVESTYQKLCKEREIRRNVKAMKTAGATVSYHQIDVRDEQKFGILIDEIYKTYGKLDGVIHGAGIIEDKLIKDKTWDSFERVFFTKTKSAFILSHKLRSDSLKFLAFFSSVAGRFGNRGQVDYTTTNDVINKLAVYLDAKWPGRVFSINWAPWRMSGMVSEGVLRQFAERGIEPLLPAQGAVIFDRELRKGKKGEAEVVAGNGPWNEALIETALPVALDSMIQPLFRNMEKPIRNNGFLEMFKLLDPKEDLYLLDHCLDDKPVLPATMAIELIAEAAKTSRPEWHVVSVSDIRVFKGITLNGGPFNVRLLAETKNNVPQQKQTVEIEVKLTDVDRPEMLYYKARVTLSKRFPVEPQFDFTFNSPMEPFHVSIREAYENWLFHGPKFQCINNIEGISKNGIIATLSQSTPKECLFNNTDEQWLLDPITLDGGLQLVLLWARKYLDITVLPSSFKAVHLYRPFYGTSLIRCHLHILKQSGDQSVYSNLYFTDQEGGLLASIEGFEATGSRQLNRLTSFDKKIKDGIDK